MADQQIHRDYVLYIFPFSLYSIMVRLTASLGELAGDGPTPTIEKKLINLHRDENISEWYLTSINSKGQVPALAGGALSAPLAESLEISKWLCEHHFKSLLPEPLRATIETLLSRLHEISGMSLSVTDSPDAFPEGIPIDAVDQLLAQQDISPQYRAALEGKKSFHDLKTRWCIKPETVLQAKQQAGDLFAATLEQYQQHGQGSMWIFGDQVGPTLLDAHIVPLIARLMDVHREELVPDELLAYAKRVIDSPAYQQVTHGRATLWNISYGRPDKLEEL